VLDALKKKYPEIKSLADVTPAVGISPIAYDCNAPHRRSPSPRPARPKGPKIREGFLCHRRL